LIEEDVEDDNALDPQASSDAPLDANDLESTRNPVQEVGDHNADPSLIVDIGPSGSGNDPEGWITPKKKTRKGKKTTDVDTNSKQGRPTLRETQKREIAREIASGKQKTLEVPSLKPLK